MTKEVKDQAKLKTRQFSLEDRQRALETHLARAQSFRKEVVETRDSHLFEVDKRIQSAETDLEKLQRHRKEVWKQGIVVLLRWMRKFNPSMRRSTLARMNFQKMLTSSRNFRQPQLNRLPLLTETK